jgi:lysozyme
MSPRAAPPLLRPIPYWLPKYLEREEGERFTAYRDQAGVLTIGDGHTGGVTEGETVTQAQIDALLVADLKTAQERLKWAIGPMCWRLLDCEYGALLSFVFNEGEKSSWGIWGDIRNGDLSAVPAELEHFVYVDGRVNKGLVNRRKADVALWLGHDPILKLPPPQSAA